MKKIILLTIILVASFGFNYTYADTKPIKVTVTERIPWADCGENLSEDPEYPKYICKVEKWTAWVIWMLWNIIKWFTYLAWLVGVLFIVYNGIMYSMGWADQALKDEAKKRIWWTLIWLVLLFLSGPLLQIIAPWIYK